MLAPVLMQLAEIRPMLFLSLRPLLWLQWRCIAAFRDGSLIIVDRRVASIKLPSGCDSVLRLIGLIPHSGEVSWLSKH